MDIPTRQELGEEQPAMTSQPTPTKSYDMTEHVYLVKPVDITSDTASCSHSLVTDEPMEMDDTLKADMPPSQSLTAGVNADAITAGNGQLAFMGSVGEGDLQSFFIVTSAQDLASLTEGDTTNKSLNIDENGCMFLLNLAESQLAVVGDTPQEKAIKEKKTISANSSTKAINQTWITSKSDKERIEKKGTQWKSGLWQKEEIELLEKNISRYCEKKGVCDPTDIIFNMSKEERKDFYRTISRGLDRPLFSVYRRVIRHYDPKNYMGKYSPADCHKLKQLHECHGNDWATIGAMLGRSASSVKDKIRIMSSTNGGKWSEDEEILLADAVCKLSDINPHDHRTSYSGISWIEVSKLVSTRTPKQCRTKWLNYLSWKVTGGQEWNKADEIALILRLCEHEYETAADIDWESLSNNWTSVRSPSWLSRKFWTLKRRVPDYKSRSLTEILSYLRDVYLPTLTCKRPPDQGAPYGYDTISVLVDGNSGKYSLTPAGGHTYVLSVPSDTPQVDGNKPDDDDVTLSCHWAYYFGRSRHVFLFTRSMVFGRGFICTMCTGNRRVKQLVNSLQVACTFRV